MATGTGLARPSTAASTAALVALPHRNQGVGQCREWGGQQS
jgi:hypothetical protein